MLKEHIKNFLSEKASVLIAPAGHGKTHFITECLSQASDEKPFLILTHTHAGIDSLKNKFQTNNVNFQRFPTLDAKKLVNAPKMSAHHRGICHF